MLTASLSFVLLETLPVNFHYVWFALLLFLNGFAMGLFASPNRAAIMNSLPAAQRGQGAGMLNTTQNSAQVLSIGLFFTLIVVGLSAGLHDHLLADLMAHGIPTSTAARIAAMPPSAMVFSAFLGDNPIQHVLATPGIFHHLSRANAAALTGRSFFPKLISAPFAGGLHAAFDFGAITCFTAAVASWLRGDGTD